jgi:hypothetical protein
MEVGNINSYPRFLERLVNNNTNKTNSVAFSPQAIYTDWSTATCCRNLVPTFVDRGVSRGQCSGSPTVVNLSLLVRSRYFSFKQSRSRPTATHKIWQRRESNPGDLLITAERNKQTNAFGRQQQNCRTICRYITWTNDIFIKGHSVTDFKTKF